MSSPAGNRLSISVIIPTYNRAAFIAAAVQSALHQTRAPHEVIVVDDGSTDETAKILDAFGPALRVIRQVNRGRSAARNSGLRAATGDAVIFLDSDDTLMPTCLERCAAALEERPDVDVVYSDAFLCDQQGCRLGLHSEYLPGPRPSGMLLPELARRNILMISSLVRRASLAGMAFDEQLESAEDYDFWRQLACWARFLYLDEPLMCYRFHEAMTVSSRSAETLAAEAHVQARILAMPQFLQLTRRERARAYCSAGIKQAMIGHVEVARGHFRRAISADPSYLGGFTLMGLSLLGAHALRYSIVKRRQLAGNRLGAPGGPLRTRLLTRSNDGRCRPQSAHVVR